MGGWVEHEYLVVYVLWLCSVLCLFGVLVVGVFVFVFVLLI